MPACFKTGGGGVLGTQWFGRELEGGGGGGVGGGGLVTGRG